MSTNQHIRRRMSFRRTVYGAAFEAGRAHHLAVAGHTEARAARRLALGALVVAVVNILTAAAAFGGC